MTMKRIPATTALLVAFLLFSPFTAIARNRVLVPPIPYSAWGTVTIDGTLAPDGTTLTACIEGVQYASTTTLGGGWYSIDVPGDDPSTLFIKEGGVQYDTVVFKVAGQTASPAGIWLGEACCFIALRAGAAPANTPTSTTTPTGTLIPPTETPPMTATPTVTSTPPPAVPRVEPYSMPRIAAPGANIGIAWEASGFASLTDTSIRWDTVTHTRDDAYLYAAPSLYGPKVGNNYGNLVAPLDAGEIFFKAHATSGGMTYWSPREYNIKYERLVNLGKESWYGGWEPDRQWLDEWGGGGGYGYGYTGGEARFFGACPDIQGTEDDFLYWRQRIGLSRYRFFAARATYEVELHFAELEYTAPGERVFSVYIEHEEVLHDFDIYQEAGAANTAVVRIFTVTVNDFLLDIELVGLDPLLCAVWVRGLQQTPTPTPTATTTYTPTPTLTRTSTPTSAHACHLPLVLK